MTLRLAYFVILVTAATAALVARPAPAPAQGDQPLAPAASAAPLAPVVQLGSGITYQGHVRKDGAPVTGTCSAVFRLFDTAAGAAPLAVVSPTVSVANGLFTTRLDFGYAPFTGETRWLEVAVGCGEPPTTLSPRTHVRPAPYALALPGLRTVPGVDGLGKPTINVIGGVVSGTVGNEASADSFDSVVAGGRANAITSGSQNSVIGGGDGNSIATTSFGSVIGGGTANRIDEISLGGVIAGGESNRVQGGGQYGAIGGGFANRIDDDSLMGVIGGGQGNVITAGARHAVIPGGRDALATNHGQQAFASGSFDQPGDAQSGLYVLRNTSYNGTTATLYLDGVSNNMRIALGRVHVLDILVAAKTESGYVAAGYQGKVVAATVDVGGFVGQQTFVNGQLGSVNIAPVHEDDPDWSCSVISGGFTIVSVRCRGDAGQNVRFVAIVRSAELHADE